jgi:hypothetical protein
MLIYIQGEAMTTYRTKNKSERMEFTPTEANSALADLGMSQPATVGFAPVVASSIAIGSGSHQMIVTTAPVSKSYRPPTIVSLPDCTRCANKGDRWVN